MGQPDSGFLREAILEVITNQIRQNTPPETKQTYDRLLAEGHSHEEAMTLIGCVVVSEIYDVLQQKKPYNEERYVAALRALPQLPGNRAQGS